jgi:hypothetical protein
MFIRTPVQKKRVEKTKLKNQNHKNQAGQQYIHQNIMGYGKLLCATEKTSPTKRKQSKKTEKKQKDPMCTWRYRGTRKMGVKIRNVDT